MAIDANILSYVWVTFGTFLINIVPAFAPPSWLFLSIHKIGNPQQSVFLIAALGVLGSVLGWAVMYFYSSKLRRFLPKKYLRNADYFRKFAEKQKLGFFAASFLFSLGPLPSNFIFISSGISKIKLLPVLAGFALGRFISYSILVYASFGVMRFFQGFGVDVKFLADIIGILATVSIFFIDWKKLVKNKKPSKK